MPLFFLLSSSLPGRRVHDKYHLPRTGVTVQRDLTASIILHMLILHHENPKQAALSKGGFLARLALRHRRTI